MKFHRHLPLALCPVICALALTSCAPSSDTNAAPPAVTENAVAENAVRQNAAPAPTAAVKSVYLETIYLPGADTMLHPRKVSRLGIDSQLKSGGDAAPALQEIIEKAPAYFPPGAKINSAKADGKNFVVDLNSAFEAPDFWSKKGEKTTELAVYALVNSAAKTGSATKPVLLTIEKQPAQNMGEMDVSGDIDPQTRLNAAK